MPKVSKEGWIQTQAGRALLFSATSLQMDLVNPQHIQLQSQGDKIFLRWKLRKRKKEAAPFPFKGQKISPALRSFLCILFS